MCSSGGGLAASDGDRDSVLFPEGIPRLAQPHDGSLVDQEFLHLAESDRDGRSALVYTLVADDDPFNPGHQLHLAVLRVAPGGEAIVGQTDLTRYSPMDLGKEGSFESVTAAVTWVSGDEMPCSIVEVNLASRIHGRGSISGGLDVFLSLDGEDTLTELAVVRDTFSSRRLEPGKYASVDSRGWVEAEQGGVATAYFEITKRTLFAAEGSSTFEELERSCSTRVLRLSCSGGEELAEEPCGSRRASSRSQELRRAGEP